MSGLNRACRKYLLEYEQNYEQAVQAAEQVRRIVATTVESTGAFIHAVSARAKSPASLRAKLRRKGYSNPNRMLTDLVGVRVITYYRDAVDPAAVALKRALSVDDSNSVDKRQALGLRDFGYRSVHLIAKLPPFQAGASDFLRTLKFEIQIRSILEHAWAEIEHEVVYKSGVAMNDATIRRFAALAGSLELFDNEFMDLRYQRDTLIEGYREEYRSRRNMRVSFDVARLLAFLEERFPQGRSWRRAITEGSPFASGLEVSCVEALKAAGVSTPASLSRVFASSRFKYAAKSFASSLGISPTGISHLAAVVLAVAVKKRSLIRLHFPEMILDAGIQAIVERRQ